MKLRIKKYNLVNNFKVIEDKGRIGRNRPGTAICPLCNEEFECNIYNLRCKKSCGCLNPNPMPELPKYINGFEVVKDLGRRKGNRRIIFKCKICKNLSEGQVQNIKSAKSCGCLKGKIIVCKYRYQHKRLFRIYKNMMARCYDKKHRSYPNYGARGITISKEWKNNPDSFCSWALNNGYTDNLSIDRIDGTRGYSKNNCRWITITEQNRNARTNVLNMELVKQIRKDYQSNIKIKDLVVKYGIARGSISHVVNNITWIETE